MMTRNIGFNELKFGMLIFALLAGITFAANCGQGIKACECGDTMMASYTMSSDLICQGTTNGIEIGTNGVTLDCANHKIQTQWKYDVSIGDGRSNIVIKNCVLVGAGGYDGGGSFSGGANILIVDGDAAYNANQPLTGASNIQVLNSRTESLTVGPQGGGWTQPSCGRSIEAFFSSGIIVTNFSMSSCGMGGSGIFLFTCHDNIMTNISGGGMDGIYLQGSWNNQIKNSNVNAQMQGIAIYNYMSQCSNNTITNVNIYGGGSRGINLGPTCDNNKIINSTVSSGGGSGIVIYSSNNQIINSNASSVWDPGILLLAPGNVPGVPSNNTITGCDIRGNIGYPGSSGYCGYDFHGISMYHSPGNTITNSTISGGNLPGCSGGSAIYINDYNPGGLALSSGNKIYNNIIDSSTVIIFGGAASTQIWDNGVTGNYYMNPASTGYSQTCAATAANICITPLTLSGSNIDNKPLKNLPSWYRRTALPEICDNDVDDDEDGLIDCADTVDCAQDPACQAPPELIQQIPGGTVTAENITVTIPPGALATSELLVTIVPSTHSFAPVSGQSLVGQPLDIGPQCTEIVDQATCQSTNGCQWNGACAFIPFSAPVTITMPGDCTGSNILRNQRIAKWIAGSWVPVVSCTPPKTPTGGIYTCTFDGRIATWNNNTCMMTAQTMSFSTYAVIDYSVQYCSTQQLQDEGTHTVNYRATDTYGNMGSGSDTVNIDLYPPSTLAQLTGVMGGFGWYTSDVVVDFITSDSMSGVNTTYYSLDNETWSTWAGPDSLSVSEISTVYYYSEDNAGLKEDVKSVYVTIDKTEPVISVTETGTEGNAQWWVSILDISISATDEESGIRELCSVIGIDPEECVQAE